MITAFKPNPPTKSIAAGLLVVLAFLALAPGLGGPLDLGGLVYNWQRNWRHDQLLGSFSGQGLSESDHFVLRYDAALDGRWAGPLLDCAEAARQAALDRVGWSPLGLSEAGPESKITILVYPDYASLGKQFSASPGFRAQGAYWGGVIQVVSPRLWLGPDPSVDAPRQLFDQGPLVHEFTHLLLDRLIPAGNYPRWLSEGLAQFVEYKETGYLWLDADNWISTPVAPASLYGLNDLDRGFDSLDNTALAYRESFLLVAYLEDAYGPDGLNALLGELARGVRLNAALHSATGLNATGLESDWHQWLDQNLPLYSMGPGKEGTLGRRIAVGLRLPARTLEGAACRS